MGSAEANYLVPRLVLVFGCLYGIGIFIATPWASPDQLMLATDVYLHAADQWLAGETIYETAPDHRPGYHFLYPPIVVILFVPYALIGSATVVYGIQTVINLGAAIATSLIVIRMLARRNVGISSADRWIIVAFFVISSYSAIQFINGQVNLWLALLFAIGFDAIDRKRYRLAGVVFGAAAVIKVFPAIMGIWLLRMRALPAVFAAIGTGLGALLLGALLMGPELTTTYLVDVLLGRFEGSTFEGRPGADAGVDGIHRQLAALWPRGSAWHTPLAILLIGGLLAAGVRRVETSQERDIAALATITAILLFLPVQPLYFPLIAVPLIMWLYTLPAHRLRWLIVIGALATMFHLDQESLIVMLSLLPVPTSMTDPLIGVAEMIFRVILPPTIGLWMLLLSCVWFQWGVPRTEKVTRTRTQGIDLTKTN